jgi:phosphoribosylglycinamide formyltransferase-1
VIAQARVPILPGDTEDRLSARVQAAEHRLYPEVIRWIAAGRLQLRGAEAWFDGAPLRRPRLLEDVDAAHVVA